MTFLSPDILFFLLLLPGLWWLVRATPPQPRQQRFPSLILLRQLAPIRQDAARTPLWLLLLRMVALALLITAFARPLHIPHRDEQTARNLVLILDNGWASAPHWEERKKNALALGEATLRQGGHVLLLLSAAEPDGHMPLPVRPASGTALNQALAGLTPRPWPTDRLALSQLLQGPAMQANLHDATVLLLSDGLGQSGDTALRDALHAASHIRDMRWPRCDLLRLRIEGEGNMNVMAEILPGCPAHSLPLQAMALADNAHFTPQESAHLLTGTPRRIKELLAETDHPAALNLPSIPGPAGMALLPGPAGQRQVGILHINGDDTILTGSGFYLQRALQNITPWQEGSMDDLLPRHPDIIIATDGTVTGTARKPLLNWVRKGGILIRFAGPDLARQNARNQSTQEQNNEEPAGQEANGQEQGGQSHDLSSTKSDDEALLPVPLLSGMRQLGGPMSWGTPQELAPFPTGTPFAGLDIPKDATISRQLLAQPTDDLSAHVWAKLKDGTPLVTARREGSGLVVLFHITPTADWSSLPLSGLFPQMLERLITHTPLIRQNNETPPLSGELPAWRKLGMDKTLLPASPAMRPLSRVVPQKVDSLHPAGFYGGAAQYIPLNLADHQPPLADEPALGTLIPAGHAVLEQPFWPALMLAALLLLLLDMLLSLIRCGLLPRLPFRRTSHGLHGVIPFIGAGVLVCGLACPPLHAAPKNGPENGPSSVSENGPENRQESDQAVPPAALAIRLAHIQTGDSATDEAVQQGLEGLTAFLNQRSTTHLDSPVGVVPGRDDLAFYPLIYWPITPLTHLDDHARAALKAYIAHNGMILIDEMGAGSAMDGTDGHATRAALKAATEGLPIPPLTRLDEQHTLSHSFYLLHDYPGRVAGQPVYVARQGSEESEDVSPVIIGNGDWAHAWAVDKSGEHPFAVIPDGESQRSLAYRFGFNTIIYALTGNYKNDQRHYPEMLNRLKNTEGAESPDESEAP